MDLALEQADWDGFEARRARSAASGKLRGRGIASFIESTGAGSQPRDEVMVRFERDGRIAMYAAPQSNGQGHETTFAQVLASTLGVPLSLFRLRSGEAGVRVVGNGAGASRTMLGTGSVFQIAAHQIVEKGIALAAEALEAAAADIEFEDGVYRVIGTDRSISITALIARYAAVSPHPLDTNSEGVFGRTYPNSCHIAEVEIDPETGVVEIVAYSGVDDAGVLVNPQIVEGQLQGGIMQGAGQVLGEHSIYDRETGQLLTGSFLDYPMPRFDTMVEPRLLSHPVPTKTNALGAKGVGETGVTGAIPTLMNAIMDALRSAGVTEFDMPASPSRIWHALQSARKARSTS
jgi:carbon-monoxide dehydrogenase large subunit